MGKRTTSDALSNLANAVTEDIFAISDEELLSEVAQEHEDPLALSKEFDEILKHVTGQKDFSVDPGKTARNGPSRDEAGVPTQRNRSLRKEV